MNAASRYLQSIRNHCKKCKSDPYQCKKVACNLFPFRDVQVLNQLTFFQITDKEHFHALVLKRALGFNRDFYWSELRKMVAANPVEPNWWGSASRILKSKGFRIIPGMRKSEFKERKGFDRRWIKKGLVHS